MRFSSPILNLGCRRDSVGEQEAEVFRGAKIDRPAVEESREVELNLGQSQQGGSSLRLELHDLPPSEGPRFMVRNLHTYDWIHNTPDRRSRSRFWC
jgi:hypothetical protein